jgi:hypothetical protein
MTRRVQLTIFMLATAAAMPARAQQAAAALTATAQSTDEIGEEGEEIVVEGQKPRGSVVGDIPPENVLGPRDIRATGATSVSELLDSVASQTGSARGRGGGQPITLLNGQRISSFRELHSLPPEAIERMEILPEEVALKYGYSADQRVVNVVLRQRFNSTNAELRGRAATEGGYASGRGEAGRLIISEGTRTSLNVRVEGNSPLYESERDIVLQPVPSVPEPVDPRPFRTLVGSNNNIRLTATHNRTILGDVSATVNAEAERNEGKSRFGVPTETVDDVLLAFPALGALTRDFESEALRAGTALNLQEGKWRLSSTGNAEFSRSTTRTDNGPDLAASPIELLPRDRSRSDFHTLTLDGTATGPLFELPAGEVTATFRASIGNTGIDSEATTDGLFTEADLGRTGLLGAANIDLPITKRGSGIGRLTANANGSVTHLSDFGEVTSVGAGLSWAPAQRFSITASWTREDGPPSLQQLGDPLLETPNVSVFDYVTGETVLVTTITGGNPDLDSDTRNVWKLGGNWQPLEKIDLRLRAEYVHQTIDDPIGGISSTSEALEDAFPERFVRDDNGTLLAVDLRPLNFRESRRDTLRWGFDFTKPLTTAAPSQRTIATMIERYAGQRPGQGPPPSPMQGGSAVQPGGGPGGHGGFRMAGAGGGRQGGRLTLSVTHQVNLVDDVTIAEGVPKLDYLDGEPLNQFGGRPRHELQFETGFYNNGFGARLQGNWRSGTTVESSTGDLKFSPYFDVDLRLFANLGERFDLVANHPFFRGTSVRLDVENIFNNRPKVRDASGMTPLSYQPDRLEPIGRTIGITLRKLFIPRRFFQQRRQQPAS